ncbi:MAG: hypothetical protein OEZ02_00875 [Anaerolineae bacterium]|nr:hypothetical protein [Anaerolineae bacterium]
MNEAPAQNTSSLIADLERVIFGHTKTREPGLISRIETLEQLVETMANERERVKNWGRGFAIGMAINIMSSIALVVTVAKLLQKLGN